VLRIPQAALRFKPDHDTLSAMLGADLREMPENHGTRRTVWLLRAGKAVPVEINVGVNDGSNAEVLSGQIRAGERAIVEVSKRSQG